MNNVVEVKNLWLRYKDGNWILKGLSFEASANEVILIVGRSGSGKSSFAKALIGIAQSIFGAEVSGEISLCSKRLDEMSLREVQMCVQIVNQDPYTHFLEPIPIDDLISYAEKFYGEEALSYVNKIVRLLNIESIVEKPITVLSNGQMRRISIAKTLIPNPKVLILDEPFMWLDDSDGMELVENVIDMLRKMGKTVIVFEHRFKYLANKVDKFYVLKNGVLEKLDTHILKNKMNGVNNQGNANLVNHKLDDLANQISQCDVVLEMNNVWYKYDDSGWILKNVDMRICKGDTIVIYGVNGSGKSTLLRILAGALKPVKGYVKRYADVSYVPQLPYLFFTEDSVNEEIEAICKAKKLGVKCIEKCKEVLKRFGYDDFEKLPLNLSWGQATRLSTLLAYFTSKKGVVLFDEPFTGSTYIEAYQLIQTLSTLSDVAKIITLSSKDYIPLFPYAKTYVLEEGVLKPFLYIDNSINQLIELATKIYS